MGFLIESGQKDKGQGVRVDYKAADLGRSRWDPRVALRHRGPTADTGSGRATVGSPELGRGIGSMAEVGA